MKNDFSRPENTAGDSGPKNQQPVAITASDLVAAVSQTVTGNAEAKRAMALALFCFQFERLLTSPSSPSFSRRNILLLSPRNTGLTTLIREMSGAAGLPIIEPDLAEYLAGAYGKGGGKNPNEMASALLGEIRGASLPPNGIGVISLERVEQLAISDRETAAACEQLQLGIARLAQGKILNMAFGGKMTKIESQSILFVASVNLEGLLKVVERRLGRGGLGFKAGEPGSSSFSNKHDALSQLHNDDLIEFGFTRNFLDSFPIRAVLRPLTEPELLRACQTQRSPLNSFCATFAGLGIILEIKPEALHEIVAEAARSELGVRGVSGVLHQVLDPVLFQATQQEKSIQRVILRELRSDPEIIFGDPIIPPCPFGVRESDEDELPEAVQKLFPRGLPRRPARPNSGGSAARWANRDDLNNWLTPSITS